MQTLSRWDFMFGLCPIVESKFKERLPLQGRLRPDNFKAVAMPSNMHAHSLRALLRIRMLRRGSPAWGRMVLGLLVLAALAGLAQQQTAEAGRAAQAGLQQAPP